MSFARTVASRAHHLIASNYFFYATLALFILSAGFIAITSLYPMAFDEEFHLGLIKIYASSWLPYGIEHTGDMAQYGAATADASYLFHYLMSFPYRALSSFGLSEQTIIILLRLINVGFVVVSLIIFKKALQQSRISPGISNIALLMVTLIPVFIMLASQINYDNLLLLVFAASVFLIVRITNKVRASGTLPLYESWLLALALLIGMSIKYAFLPLALGIFIWFVGLCVTGIRAHKHNIPAYIKTTFKEWFVFAISKKTLLVLLTFASLFFASHYATNTLSYGSPIPACDQVFTEDECRAYGPWNRNKNYIAEKSQSFTPLSFPEYMAVEWFPGMTERLTFAVAGKTNGFQTKSPLPVVIIGFVILSIIGAVCLIAQIIRKRTHWLVGFTVLLCLVYVGVLSWQLYGDYVKTAQPVAINGRYLLPLLPLVAAVLIQSMRGVIRKVTSGIIASITVILVAVLLVGGAGIGTYILQSEAHWYWPGFGQASYEFIHPLLTLVTLPFRY